MRPRLTEGASMSFKAGGIRRAEVKNCQVYTCDTRQQYLSDRIAPKIVVHIKKRHHVL